MRLATVVLATVASRAAPRRNDTNVTLTVAFTSDLHGEIAPLKEAYRLLRRVEEPVLLVDAGDPFVGTAYFRSAGPEGMARVMRAMGYKAITVGNHELEYHKQLANFSAAVRAPLVSLNLCRFYPGVRCSYIARAGALRVGLVGYTDTSSLIDADVVPGLALTGTCDATGAFGAAVLSEAAALRPRVDVVVALGHCGYDFDVALVARAHAERPMRGPTVDAAVGGHTHYVRSSDGADYGDTPAVAQAGESGSHLGLLRLMLAGSAGAGYRVAAASSEALPLGKGVTPRVAHARGGGPPDAHDDLANVRFAAVVVKELREHTDGGEAVPWRVVAGGADARACRRRECALGNLLADAMARYGGACEVHTAVPVIALLESGSVRGVLRPGAFGRAEATRLLPWGNTYVVLRFPSVAHIEAFAAHGAAQRAPWGTGGAFLQVSGNARLVVPDHADRSGDGPRLLVAAGGGGLDTLCRSVHADGGAFVADDTPPRPTRAAALCGRGPKAPWTSS